MISSGQNHIVLTEILDISYFASSAETGLATGHIQSVIRPPDKRREIDTFVKFRCSLVLIVIVVISLPADKEQ